MKKTTRLLSLLLALVLLVGMAPVLSLQAKAAEPFTTISINTYGNNKKLSSGDVTAQVTGYIGYGFMTGIYTIYAGSTIEVSKTGYEISKVECYNGSTMVKRAEGNTLSFTDSITDSVSGQNLSLKVYWHTYSTDWNSDENQHWHDATCDHTTLKSGLAYHADTNNDHKCDTCDYVMSSHTFSTEWSHDDDYHWHAATCGHDVRSDEGSHADSGNHFCVCGVKMGDHTFDTAWSKNETQHWHAATCGHDVKDSPAAHADPNKDHKCDTCDYVMSSHTDADNDHVCDICGNVGTHSFSTDWSHDADYHWHAATCGHDVKDAEGLHVDSDQNNLCDTCGASLKVMVSTITDGGKTLEVEYNGVTRKVTLKVDGASIKNPFTAKLEGLEELAAAIGKNVTAKDFVYKYSETGKNYKLIDPKTFTPKEGYYQVGVVLEISPRVTRMTRAVNNTNHEVQTYELYVQYTVTNPTTTAATGDSRPIELVMTAMVMFGALAAAAYALDNKGKFLR